jgi:predicted RNase H-like nuclease (RuvC/YqgF family)
VTCAPEEKFEQVALDRLTTGVDRLLRAHLDLGDRLARAEERLIELEGVLADFGGDGMDVVRMAQELRAAQEENAALRERLEEGRDVVDRILSRIRYLSEQGGA